MYSRVQRTGKKADDSSTNQFAPRPFKVESTAQDDGNDNTVLQSKALPDYKKSCLLTNIEILRPGGYEPPLQPKLEIQPQWEDARESYEPQGVKSGGDFLTINRDVIQNKEQPTDYKTQTGISWVLGNTRGAASKPPAPPLGIQTKLTIGEPGDKYEQEADRVAADVVQRINAPQSENVPAQLQTKEQQSERIQRDIAPMIPKFSIFPPGVSSPPPPPKIQMKLSIREPGDEREPTFDQPIYTPVQPLIQRVKNGGMAASPDVEAGIQRARGGGQPLAESIREPMEQAFGADFSGVRVHTDAQADQLNQSIQAKAFTTGQEVYFRQGAYEPGRREGQELLAHELTHVVQQKMPNKGEGMKRESGIRRTMEDEARAMGQASERRKREGRWKGRRIAVLNPWQELDSRCDRVIRLVWEMIYGEQVIGSMMNKYFDVVRERLGGEYKKRSNEEIWKTEEGRVLLMKECQREYCDEGYVYLIRYRREGEGGLERFMDAHAIFFAPTGGHVLNLPDDVIAEVNGVCEVLGIERMGGSGG